MYLYLHGFNSSGASAKGRYFTQSLAPFAVHTPTYPPDPEAAMQQLQQTLEALLVTAVSDESIILIGSSLGGFYAQYLAHRYNLPVVLINPALQPALTLRPYLGWQTNYYNNARYYFGEAELATLLHYEVPDPCAGAIPTLVLLDAGDEIIDYRFAQHRYADCGHVIVYPDGNHQFQHLAEASAAIRHFRMKLRTSPQI